MKRRKILWGHTSYGPHRIKIFRSFINTNYDGLTWKRAQGYTIEIHADVFEQPALFDETLIHEFVHCIEYFHEINWKSMCDPKSECCSAVKAIGHGLAQMLRELVQVPFV